MVKGLATVIYYVSDLDQAKAWYSAAFQQAPYFQEPFCVGFNIAGYELGLHPAGPGGRAGSGGTVAYWRVPRIDDAIGHFTGAGLWWRQCRMWTKASRSPRSAIRRAHGTAALLGLIVEAPRYWVIAPGIRSKRNEGLRQRRVRRAPGDLSLAPRGPAPRRPCSSP
jgi:hypothetical protein